MKELEFETSKGRFVLVDNPILPQAMSITTKYIKLSEITEEQASRIVNHSIHTNLYAHYVENIEVNTYCYTSAIESLHSLLKSKGIHLFENPAPLLHHTRLEVEQKTFYNPYIFKL